MAWAYVLIYTAIGIAVSMYLGVKMVRAGECLDTDAAFVHMLIGTVWPLLAVAFVFHLSAYLMVKLCKLAAAAIDKHVEMSGKKLLETSNARMYGDV